MKKNQKVSVIIPTYNRKNMIGDAIQSVLNQTHRNFEIIIIDDASDDNTEEVVKSFNDVRIKYILHKENKGGSAARNTGIKKARGKFIAFLDSDDWWHPKKLELQLLKMQTSRINPDLVYTGIKQVNNDGELIKEILPKFRGNILNELLNQNVVGTTSSVCLKKEIFGNIGLFDENLPSRQDIDFWIRAAGKYTFDYVKTPLVYQRIHKNRITESLDLKIKGRLLLLYKIYDHLKKDNKKLSKYYYETGILYLCKGSMNSGRKFLMKSLIAFPYIKTALAIGFTLLGFNGFILTLRLKKKLKLEKVFILWGKSLDYIKNFLRIGKE
jgi:glycosyltransferase involved in cell wall biosynthesis